VTDCSSCTGPERTAVRRPLALILATFAVGCLGGDSAERAADATAIAAVFETAVPYSGRSLAASDLGEFLAAHPEFRSDSAAIADFYARRDLQFAWFVRDSLTSAADAFIAIAGVEGYGEGERRTVCDSCAASAELRLTGEFFRFAARNYGGIFSRDLRELDWFIPRAKKDLAQLMDSLAAGTMDLSAYEPLHPQYHQLRDAFRQLSALADLPWPAITMPAGVRRIDPGDLASSLPAIRERLRHLGDLAEADTSTVLDSVLVEAVQRFQERHGVAPDGVIGPAFLRALNVPPAERLRTLLVNMERLRWVPEELPPNALMVNIPEFRLHVYEDGDEVMTMPIVVGAHATHTVIFSATLSTVVMSPTWTIPASITRDEILPAVARDPDYLRRNNMEIIGGSETAPVIRQRPGANNALGRVKFVFPNNFGIFMHDTPARALFSRDQRAFSHGCIRLSEPRALAEYLLRDHDDWPPERIGDVMLGGRETAVQLAEPRPVVIVYFTSWVDVEGRLNFRDDVYGHDRKLAGELFR
jgi:L,D-transpeptidase YcbB